jgi:hypothetical protein
MISKIKLQKISNKLNVGIVYVFKVEIVKIDLNFYSLGIPLFLSNL